MDAPDIFFRKATIRICGSLNIHRAMLHCLDYIGSQIPATGMLLHLYDPEFDALRTVAAVMPDRPQGLQRHVAVPAEMRGLTRREYAHPPDLVIINDPAGDPEYRTIIRQIWDHDVSMVRLTLTLEGERVGMLIVYALGTDRYRPQHAERLRLLREPFAIAMSNALHYQELETFKEALADDNRYLQQELARVAGDEIIGADFGLKEVMARVRQVAPLDTTVLLQGETGVGKELIANAIHAASGRHDRPLIKVNCGAIPESLVDSELFGHEKGAFTGAVTQRRGRFERAHTGTIFLDEIGELPHQVQVRLLRVLQQHQIERVGGTKTVDVDVRVICATHRNLEELVRGGQFREDLWFRLNVFPLMIPPLRQRRDDIPALVAHFIDRKARDLRIGRPPHLVSGSIDRLRAYPWPGNVRELENVVERALIVYKGAGGDGLLAFDVPRPAANDDPAAGPPSSETAPGLPDFATWQRRYFESLLQASGGRIQGAGGAARRAGMHPNTLRSRLEKLGIPFGRAR